MLNPLERYKYDAYKSVGDMSSDKAKLQYVEVIALKTLCENEKDEGKAYNARLLENPATAPPFLAALLNAGDSESAWEQPIPALWHRFVDAATWSANNKSLNAELIGLFNQAVFGDNFLD